MPALTAISLFYGVPARPTASDSLLSDSFVYVIGILGSIFRVASSRLTGGKVKIIKPE